MNWITKTATIVPDSLEGFFAWVSETCSVDLHDDQQYLDGVPVSIAWATTEPNLACMVWSDIVSSQIRAAVYGDSLRPTAKYEPPPAPGIVPDPAAIVAYTATCGWPEQMLADISNSPYKDKVSFA